MSRFSRIINVEDMKITALPVIGQKSISATFIAKTFIYTGDESATHPGEGQPAAGAAGAPTSLGPAGVSARKLKERAEGKGAE